MSAVEPLILKHVLAEVIRRKMVGEVDLEVLLTMSDIQLFVLSELLLAQSIEGLRGSQALMVYFNFMLTSH